MERDWRASDFHDRLAWARGRLGISKLKEAADLIGEKAGTYRTWERSKAEDGRKPDLPKIKHIAKRMGVSWIWLATGDGDPLGNPDADELMSMASQLATQISRIPEEKRDDAVRAAEAMLGAYSKAS